MTISVLKINLLITIIFLIGIRMPSTNNPRLEEPVRRLTNIGPLYSRRARRYGIHTMRELRATMSRQSKAQNRQFLAHWLENPRRTRCVPPARGRRLYSVRPFNEYAYQSVISYMRRHHYVSLEQLPAPLTRRPVRISHPRRCTV